MLYDNACEGLGIWPRRCTHHLAADAPSDDLQALPKAPRLSGQTVTYKQYGRSYTVPVEMAPEKPTRQQRKVAAKTARYYSRVAKLRGQLEAAEGAVGYTPKPNASAIGSGGVKSAVGAGQ